MKASHKTYEFAIAENQEWVMRMYQSEVNAIIVRSTCGKKIQVNKHHLRPFVAHSGLHGRFVITVTIDNRFVSIRKIV